MKRTWNDTDFDEMSWHDNAVHGLRLIEGKYGCGDIVLDLDHILEWLPSETGGFQFRIAPAELTFHDASSLRVSLDYAAASATLSPFSIHQIRFEPMSYVGGAQGRRWTIEVNWPKGEVTFEAPRFTQVLTGSATLSECQHLSAEQRRQLRDA